MNNTRLVGISSRKTKKGRSYHLRWIERGQIRSRTVGNNRCLAEEEARRLQAALEQPPTELSENGLKLSRPKVWVGSRTRHGTTRYYARWIDSTTGSEVSKSLGEDREEAYRIAESIEKEIVAAVPDSSWWTVNQMFLSLASQISAMAQDVQRIKVRLQEFDGRRVQPKADVKWEAATVIWKAYNGKCPNCEVKVIVDCSFGELKIENSLHVDHWYSRSRASADDVWAICGRCNMKLGAAGSIKRAGGPLERFEKYQTIRKSLKKCKNTIEEAELLCAN